MPCLTEEEVLAFLEGALRGNAAARVEEHLAGCATCRTVVAELSHHASQDQPPSESPTRAEAGRLSPSSGGPETPLPAGTLVGRYVIEAPLGAGAGGAVYRARDPQLKRAVALKIVPALLAGPGDDLAQAQARVLREAEAMARLQHPNVVAAFDAGAYDERVFIVMELVEGETLAAWLRVRNRDWREILGAFIEAGRGLVAAHAAGLVHRDFKPGNVLVGRDGRVRVMDFGLARPPGVVRGADVSSMPSRSPGRASEGLLTAVAGTPYFMAPEQFAGGVASARTDQYSFAVALFRALYGYHPTEDRRGIEAAPAERPDIPVAVHRALVPALSDDPDARHGSVDDLLTALQAARGPAAAAPLRARRALLLLAGCGAAVLAWIVLPGSPRQALRGPTAAVCGNGVVEAGEECDDGNVSRADGCLPTCRFARCGDGFVRASVEECDDGNARDGDGCSARCLACREGDASFVWPQTGHCYSRHDREARWPQADQQCARLGAHLVTYSSSYESYAVRATLFNDRRSSHWIGLYRGVSGAFAWLTNEPLLPLPQWWERGEPGREGPPCVAANPAETLLDPATDNTGSPWRAATCGEPRAFVCEREGWILRPKDNHAYRLFHAVVGWDEAHGACAAAGGHLAVISDVEEQAFVPLTTRTDVWVGATDRAQEGRFIWMNGARFEMSRFAPGEPDDGDGTADCVVLGRDRVFHDRVCGTGHVFLCEID